MRIALVVQRYGAELAVGPELHCRLIAEHLSQRHDVDVLTTCARESTTWDNAYPEGPDRLRGVTVRRFANAQTSDPGAFKEYSDWIFSNSHTAQDEESWLQQQGPWCPALIEYLEQHHESYDALIFFSYRYAPTVLGLRVDPRRSILVPTAQDEPAIRLDIYRPVFSLPAGIAYDTAVERRFLRSHFSIEAHVEEIVGCGVELPPHLDAERLTPAEGDAETNGATTKEDGGDAQPPMGGAVFKRRHRLYGPFVLYGERIEPGRGCEELIEYFGSYAAQRGEATLVLMGVKLMRIPEEPFIRFAGMLTESERLEALEAATVVVVPSPHESLSLPALEAFAVGTPVIANARSDVLTDHCQRSNGGLYYVDRAEFAECLQLLVGNDELRAEMGRNGRRYVREHYSWPAILDKYERLIAAVGRRNRRRAAPRRRRKPRGQQSTA